MVNSLIFNILSGDRRGDLELRRIKIGIGFAHNIELLPLIYDKFCMVLPLIYDKFRMVLPLIYDKVGQRRAYWSRPNNGAEMDFIYLYDSRIIPIEVKNGTNAHLRSIQVFMDMSPEDIAIRIWSGNYSVDSVKTPSGKPFRLVNIPFYLIGCINDILGNL